MKKIYVLLAINILATIILGVFLVCHIYFDREINNEKVLDTGGINIAYINSDTIFNNYSYVVDMQKELENKRSLMEKEMNNKIANFQDKIVYFKKQLAEGTLSQERAQEKEQLLMYEQEQLKMLEDSLQRHLSNMQLQVSLAIQDSVINYIKRKNYDKKYNCIFAYAKGGGILSINKNDITKDILNGLNEEYKNKK